MKQSTSHPPNPWRASISLSSPRSHTVMMGERMRFQVLVGSQMLSATAPAASLSHDSLRRLVEDQHLPVRLYSCSSDFFSFGPRRSQSGGHSPCLSRPFVSSPALATVAPQRAFLLPDTISMNELVYLRKYVYAVGLLGAASLLGL